MSEHQTLKGVGLPVHRILFAYLKCLHFYTAVHLHLELYNWTGTIYLHLLVCAVLCCAVQLCCIYGVHVGVCSITGVRSRGVGPPMFMEMTTPPAMPMTDS